MSAISDWFYKNVYGGSDLATQGRELDAQLSGINKRDYSPGGVVYNQIADESGKDAADSAWNVVQQHEATGSYDYQVNQDLGDSPSSGLGAIIKDLFVLAVIGGALWVFFNFGGYAFLKKLSGKYSWMPAALALSAVVLAVVIYNRVKKTGTDTETAANNFADNLKTAFSF